VLPTPAPKPTGCLDEAKRALILEDTSDILYDVATDAIDAWRRAEDRATLGQQLADQEAGGYNVWDGAA
jgi:hypothetical protein